MVAPPKLAKQRACYDEAAVSRRLSGARDHIVSAPADPRQPRIINKIIKDNQGLAVDRA